jgi:hypothetical protein
MLSEDSQFGGQNHLSGLERSSFHVVTPWRSEIQDEIRWLLHWHKFVHCCSCWYEIRSCLKYKGTNEPALLTAVLILLGLFSYDKLRSAPKSTLTLRHSRLPEGHARIYTERKEKIFNNETKKQLTIWTVVFNVESPALARYYLSLHHIDILGGSLIRILSSTSPHIAI